LGVSAVFLGYPDLLDLVNDLADGRIPFAGKFIMVADECDFPDDNVPEVAGAWIQMTNREMLDYIGKSLGIIGSK
jgi:hypothetical protein